MIRLIPLAAAVLTLGLLVTLIPAQDEVKPKKIPPRFGFSVDEFTYPQKTPKDALQSIVRALDRKSSAYMLAHLIDPAYVDYWVLRYKVDYAQGKEEAKILLAFDRLVRETNQYYQDDPLILKDLRAFAAKAEWTEDENRASGVVAAIPARKVFLHRLGDRWFLENRQQ